jgi:hypothetical protein
MTVVFSEQDVQLFRFKHSQITAHKPLRVGIVHSAGSPPPTTYHLLLLLKRISGMDAHLFPLPTSAGCKRPGWLVDRLYSMSRAKFDPFGDPSRPIGDPVTPDFLETLRAAACDLLIWLAGVPGSEVPLHTLATHGVLTVRLGERESAIPFWNEATDGRDSSSVTVFWHEHSFAHGRPVRNAETAVSGGLYITENMAQPAAAMTQMLVGVCMDVQQRGDSAISEFRGLTPAQLDCGVGRDFPTNLEAAGFIGKKLLRSVRLRLALQGKIPKWFVALRRNRGDSITDPEHMNTAGFIEIPLPAGIDSMADPFLCHANGRDFLLFEAITVGDSDGRLWCVELLPDGTCSGMIAILEQPYHLSYPCVVHSHGELFLIPETSATGRVDLYRFRRFPEELELVASPVEGVELVDTTPVFVDGLWYIFTTTREQFMETLLFSASRLEGPWTLHPMNPVSTSVKNSRSAGHLFWRDGRLFRVTQDCSVRYGYAMTVNEVTRLTPTEFSEHRVSYLAPHWAPGLLGTHTWNESNEWQVVDWIRPVRTKSPPAPGGSL